MKLEGIVAYNWKTFPNIGYLHTTFSKEMLTPILKEVEKIKLNFEDTNLKSASSYLAGNIEKEFHLVDSKEFVFDLMLPYTRGFQREFNYLTDVNVLTTPKKLVLENAWVNFQKKYEFNPLHNHSGLLSFVIWLNIPYNKEDEVLAGPGKQSNSPLSGTFSFSYVDSIGKIKTHNLFIDKSWEYTMIMFPSNFMHTVYPFYTSDDYRISVSGNFVFSD